MVWERNVPDSSRLHDPDEDRSLYGKNSINFAFKDFSGTFSRILLFIHFSFLSQWKCVLQISQLLFEIAPSNLISL